MLCSIGKVCLQRLVNYQGNSRCKALGGELNSNDVMGCGVQDVQAREKRYEDVNHIKTIAITFCDAL